MSHVGPETLAEYREGLLSPRRSHRITRHLSRCQRCARTDAGLAHVTSLLSGTAPVAMPAGLAARLDAVLAGEAARASQAARGAAAEPGRAQAAPATTAPAHATVPRPQPATPAARSARRNRRRPVLTLRVAAATAAVLAIAGGGAYALARQVGAGGTTSAAVSAPRRPVHGAIAGGAASARAASPGAGAAGTGLPDSGQKRLGSGAVNRARAAATYPVVASGTDYLPGHLAAQVSALLARSAAPQPGTFGGSQPAAASPAAGDVRDLSACVLHVTGGRTPTLVDVARYAGRPAAIIVVRDAAGAAGWVVGRGCSASAPDVITRFSLPAAG